MAISTNKDKRLVNDRLISTSAIPYMRKKTISYDCKGLRPNAIVDCFFDGREVLSNQQVDSSGNLVGSFVIPGKIPTGKKIFEVYDSEETTSASAEYTANGIIQVRQRTITSIRTPPLRIVARPTRRPRLRFRLWKDPLAQSFLVNSIGGAFITSLDLFFRSKDSSLPVTIYITEMENGFPTNNIVPFSTVVQEAVNINADGANPDNGLTTFTFSDPLYLEDQTEYAFVVMSDSNKYECWISTLGNIDLVTNQSIAKQPYLGSLFKSQNSTTWTADQLSDLRFTIRQAKFESVSDGIYNVVNGTSQTFDSIDINIGDVTLPETEASYTYSVGSVSNEPFNNTEEVKFTSSKTVDVSNNRLSVQMNLTTTNENISPIIDKERIGAVTVLNKLNPDKTFNAQQSCGVYVSQDVDLLNPAETLKVILTSKNPAGSSMKVYFKTQSTKRTYLTHDTSSTLGRVLDNNLLNKALHVYQQDDSIVGTVGTKTLTKLGELIITGYDLTKIYYKSATDVSMFLDSADVNDVHFITDDGTLDGVEIWQNYTAAQAAVGGYVNMLGSSKLFKRLGNDTQPSISNPDWVEVPTIAWDDVSGSSVEVDAITWRDMTSEISISESDSFVEYTYSPTISPESEFSSFAIKIENYVDPLNSGNIPEITDARAIAVY